jgi:hypothetical protein
MTINFIIVFVHNKFYEFSLSFTNVTSISSKECEQSIFNNFCSPQMFGGKKNYVAGTWLKAMNRNEKEGKKIRNKKKMFLSTKNLKYFKMVVILI